MVGTSNTSTSTGSIGHYAKTIAEAGLIAFCFAQSPEVRQAHATAPLSRPTFMLGACTGPEPKVTNSTLFPLVTAFGIDDAFGSAFPYPATSL